MRIAVSADHAGVDLKDLIAGWLRDQGHEVLDLGTNSHESVDYPKFGAMLAEALAGSGDRVEKFRRDGWARAWPAGPEMLCYMLCHEAHHRGQVCMLAHQLGFPLPKQVAYGIWNWEKLWKECGSSNGPGCDC